MTVSPALLQVETDTRCVVTTSSPARLRTAAHKLTSCGEFSRRSEALLAADDAGLQHVQALGAWLQLWVVHSRVDGTIWLTATEAAAALGVSAPTWRRWAQLLEQAGLLAPHGRTYLVPNPAAMEGCMPGHRAPGGWRSLHRSTLQSLGEALDTRTSSGARRAGALGLFAIVLLRHTYGRAGIDVVQTCALPALQRLLDRKTVSTYLQLLDGVLSRPARGRLRYAGRQLLEHGWPDTVQDVGRAVEVEPQEVAFSPSSDVSAPAAGSSFPPSHARPLGQVLPLGQDPTLGVAAGTFVELLTALDRRAPGAATAIARHRLAKALLRSALLEVGRDVERLAYELTRSSLLGARDLAGVIAHRVPDAVDTLRLRALLNDQQSRAERQAYAIHENRERRAAAAARVATEALRDRTAAEQAAQEVLDAAGDNWPRLLTVIADRQRLVLRGPALEAAARARVREVANVLSSGSAPSGNRATAQQLVAAVRTILEGLDQ